jgi:hypothetical protein
MKILDPFAQIGLRDYGFVETWTENLKSILGKHVYRVVTRFDGIANMIAQQLVYAAQRRQPPMALDIREIQSVLTLKTQR